MLHPKLNNNVLVTYSFEPAIPITLGTVENTILQLIWTVLIRTVLIRQLPFAAAMRSHSPGMESIAAMRKFTRLASAWSSRHSSEHTGLADRLVVEVAEIE
jgi:hypothetical protein